MSEAIRRAVEARRSGMTLCLALGALAALGQAPLGWAWLTFAALTGAMALLSLPTRWPLAAWRGWAFGTGYFAVALSWIVEPFLVDIGRHGWMAPFALFFMAGGLALFWALAFGLATRLGHSQRQRVLFAVGFLTAGEMLRSVMFTGFPWALIGHVWIGWPQMQVAALVGAHGLTLLTLIAAALPTVLGPRQALLGGLLGVALISGTGLGAKLRVPDGEAPSADPAVIIRLVQPNAPQHLKWDPDMIPVWFDRKLEFTSASSEEGALRPDVIIWPETSVPWLLEYADAAFKQIAEAAQGSQVVVGVQRRDEMGRWFNTLVALDETGAISAQYDKHHLVPFGEYMPLMELFAKWGVFGLAANETGGYTSGAGPQVLDLGAIGRVLPLICYEAIFPNDIAQAPERPDWMVQITNDAWFGEVSGPYQHLAIARLRALEQGLPLVRAANTGVSTGFDPFGRPLGEVALGQAGFVDLSLPAPLPVTVYSRFGDIPVLLALALLALGTRLAVRGSRAG